MTKQERILNKVTNDKSVMKYINSNEYYGVDRFIHDAQDYIKAVKTGRMINSIDSVSSSGMSRTMKFMSCEKSKHDKSNFYRQYFSFFKALGHSEARSGNGYFSIGGGGMDMVFNTNYNIIHALKRLGFISEKECAKLAQMTPTTI